MQGQWIEERYIRLGNSQLLHPAMLSLSDKAVRIYTYMLLESGGKRNLHFQDQNIANYQDTMYSNVQRMN